MLATKEVLAEINKSIRVIHDWPETGVSFRDITPLLRDHTAFNKVIEILVERYKDQAIDVVVGLDARGFIFAPVVAHQLGVGFVPVRKKGKLPFTTHSQDYTLEYGDANTVEMHIDAIHSGERVLIIDDLIATGGTMLAACKLVEKVGGLVVECAVVTDLLYLDGSKKIRLEGYPVYSILEYE